MRNERQNTSPPRPKPRLGRRLLLAFLDDADQALRQTRLDDEVRAAEDDQCRLRPEYSCIARGYRETG